MENYFVINATEDGLYMQQMSKDELLKSITPNEYGDTDFGNPENIRFLDKMPDDLTWHEYESNAILIIKGEVVVPKPKKIVTEYDV